MNCVEEGHVNIYKAPKKEEGRLRNAKKRERFDQVYGSVEECHNLARVPDESKHKIPILIICYSLCCLTVTSLFAANDMKGHSCSFFTCVCLRTPFEAVIIYTLLIMKPLFSLGLIRGGLTNYLYLCSLPKNMDCQPGEQRNVLVRIYGEILDNRAKFYEGVIFTLLAERGFGPHLYGVFSSGRIEQYIPVSIHDYHYYFISHIDTCLPFLFFFSQSPQKAT